MTPDLLIERQDKESRARFHLVGQGLNVLRSLLFAVTEGCVLKRGEW